MLSLKKHISNKGNVRYYVDNSDKNKDYLDPTFFEAFSKNNFKYFKGKYWLDKAKNDEEEQKIIKNAENFLKNFNKGKIEAEIPKLKIIAKGDTYYIFGHPSITYEYKKELDGIGKYTNIGYKITSNIESAKKVISKINSKIELEYEEIEEEKEEIGDDEVEKEEDDVIEKEDKDEESDEDEDEGDKDNEDEDESDENGDKDDEDEDESDENGDKDNEDEDESDENGDEDDENGDEDDENGDEDDENGDEDDENGDEDDENGDEDDENGDEDDENGDEDDENGDEDESGENGDEDESGENGDEDESGDEDEENGDEDEENGDESVENGDEDESDENGGEDESDENGEEENGEENGEGKYPNANDIFINDIKIGNKNYHFFAKFYYVPDVYAGNLISNIGKKYELDSKTLKNKLNDEIPEFINTKQKVKFVFDGEKFVNEKNDNEYLV